jgi:hypothetical protein
LARRSPSREGPRTFSGFPRLIFLAALGLGGVACQADSGDAGCLLHAQVTLAGTPLTLLSNERLDQVGAGFFLLGLDSGGATTSVRWGALDASGVLTGEHAYALPSGVTSAYYAVAGVSTPGDTVLVGYLGTDPAGENGELAVIALPADGSPPAAPASNIVTFPGSVPTATSVAMMSSRVGMNAGLTWIDETSGHVQVATVNGAGLLTGAPVVTSNASPDFSCLGFSPGKDDLTVVYYAMTTTVSSLAGWVIAETNEAGSVDSTTVLAFNRPMGKCAVVTPTPTGYGLVWQDSEGGWLAEYVALGSMLSTPYPFASSSSFGGTNLQPPLVGLAPFGTDFGVLIARPLDVELWRIDHLGNRQAGALIFPSIDGTFGDVSALPMNDPQTGESMAVTYADYTSIAGAATPTGGRLFANAVCY